MQCTPVEKTATWFSDLCSEHRREYLKKKRDERLKAKRLLRQITKTKDIVCEEFGHSYVRNNYVTDICCRCGTIIPSRMTRKQQADEYYRSQISKMLFSDALLIKIERLHINPPKLWHSNESSANVANALYYLRYSLRWSFERIAKTLEVRRSVLNAYICHFPAIERNGKIVIL